MGHRIKILHLEDDPRDAELVQAILQEEQIPFEIRHVRNREGFERALEAEPFDILLCDYRVPDYTGFDALKKARARFPELPVILVSGTLGEDQAVESLKAGATDYILKQHPARLGEAVRRALRELEERLRRRRADQALRENEERLSCVLMATNDAVWDWNIEADSHWWNQALQTLFGYTPAEASGGLEWWLERIHPADRERVRKRLRGALRGAGQNWGDDYRFQCKDATYAFVFDRGYIIRDASGRPLRMLGSMMDITDRKAAEQKIRWQAELLDKTQDAIYVRDNAQRIRFWNAGAERLYGWSAAEALGRRSDELLDADESQPVNEKGEWRGELKHRTRSRSEVVVESRRTQLRDEEDRPFGTLSINTDVTEKKRLEAQFLHAQRLECLGALAGGIAHDLNNMLTPIVMAAALVREDVREPRARQWLDVITSSSRRGAELIQQILTFARGAQAASDFNPAHVIRDVEKLLKAALPRQIEVEVECARDLRPMRGDPTQLHQVLMNLCINARDAMPEGGMLSLRAWNADTDGRAEQVALEVRDTGTGMAPEVLARVFEPFFTTKAPGKGTGLGLATVKKIVAAHMGGIEVESEPGKGTAFRLLFPAVQQAAAEAGQEMEIPLAGSGERILLADDEAAVREMLKTTLEAMNYELAVVSNGAAALKLIETEPRPFDLILTDLGMPLMGGAEMAAELLRRESHPPLVVMTGAVEEEVFAGIQAQAKVLLRKPFTTLELLKAIRAGLALKSLRGQAPEK